MTNSKYLFLNMYDELYGNIQFLCNSEVRIKLLKSLDESPKTMRELNDLVLLSYSSISNNLNKLISLGFLTKSERKFYLTNMAYLNLINCLDFNNSIKVADSFDNFLKTHDIGPLCDDSLKNLSSLIARSTDTTWKSTKGISFNSTFINEPFVISSHLLCAVCPIII